MTMYLLDTNACIALITGTQARVRRRFQRTVAKDGVMLLSSIVAFELWYGVANCRRMEGQRPTACGVLRRSAGMEPIRRGRRPGGRSRSG